MRGAGTGRRDGGDWGRKGGGMGKSAGVGVDVVCIGARVGVKNAGGGDGRDGPGPLVGDAKGNGRENEGGSGRSGRGEGMTCREWPERVSGALWWDESGEVGSGTRDAEGVEDAEPGNAWGVVGVRGGNGNGITVRGGDIALDCLIGGAVAKGGARGEV